VDERIAEHTGAGGVTIFDKVDESDWYDSRSTDRMRVCRVSSLAKITYNVSDTSKFPTNARRTKRLTVLC
jgi:hypothetical protein